MKFEEIFKCLPKLVRASKHVINSVPAYATIKNQLIIIVDLTNIDKRTGFAPLAGHLTKNLVIKIYIIPLISSAYNSHHYLH